MWPADIVICVRCSRPLLRAALSVRNGDKTHAYGPKCAKVSGLIDRTQRVNVARAKINGTSWIDPLQLALELTE